MKFRHPRIIGEGPDRASSVKSIVLIATIFIMAACLIAVVDDTEKSNADPVLSGQCGDNLTWYIDNGVLTIEGSGAMYDFEEDQTRWGGNNISNVDLPDGLTHIGDLAFYQCYGLYSISVPDSVESIGDRAFFDCPDLKSVKLPTGLDTIGISLFEGCSDLSSITIPGKVVSIGDLAFFGCGSLSSISIPSSVKSIGMDAFCACDGLLSVTISAGVESIGNYAFMGCENLKSVTVPETVNSMGNGVFSNCTALEAVVISGPVESIGKSMFNECSKLGSVVIPDSVKSIGEMAIYKCTSLLSITIPDSVTTIGDKAFFGCSSLSSITIPFSVTTIGDHVFEDCTSLASVTVTSGLESIGEEAFKGCTSLQTVHVPESNPLKITARSEGNGYIAYYTDGITLDEELSGRCGDGLIWSYDEASGDLTIEGYGAMYDFTDNQTRWGGNYDFTCVSLPDELTHIGNYAFYDCEELDSVAIPGSVESIGEGAFTDCTSLQSVTIPSSVTAIGDNAFFGCRSLASIAIPGSVESIGEGVFQLCSELSSVTIPASVTSIGKDAFNGCSSLPSVTIPGSVTSIGKDAFYCCTSLTSVEIPDSVESLGGYAFAGCSGLGSVTLSGALGSIDEYTFYRCSSLESLTIPGSVKSIGNYAFCQCTGLESITIPDGVESIGTQAFGHCTGLSSLTIPASVTTMGIYAFEYAGISSLTLSEGLTLIGDYAFQNCRNLASVDIPASVESIGDGAFGHCFSLTSLVVPVTVTAMGEYVFRSCTGLTSLTISDGITTISPGEFSSCSSLTTVTIPDSVQSIGEQAFFRCTGMTSVSIPDSVVSIGDNAFEECSGLTSVIIPDSVTYIGKEAFQVYAGSSTSITVNGPVEYIGDRAFKGCTGLESVTVLGPMSYIGEEAFKDCTGLTAITILGPIKTIGDRAIRQITAPISISGPVTSIGPSAFEQCTGLESIYLSSDMTEIGWGAFIYCSNLKTVYVGCGCVLDIANAELNSVGYIRWASPEIITCHDYDITYDWSDDGKLCDISMECQAHPEADCSFKASSSMEVIIEPTCTEPGKARYSVQGDHDNCNYFSYVDKAIPPSHLYVPSYVWEDDGSSCTVNLVCSRDPSHKASTVAISTSSIQIPATCTEKGTTRYSVSGTYLGCDYSSTKDIQDIPALSHAYSAAYLWADDGSSCKVNISCANNHAHDKSIEADVSSEILVPATCTEKGTTRYSVSGVNDGFQYSSLKDIQDIPALNHAYSAAYTWADDGSSCIVDISCANNHAHDKSLEPQVFSEIVSPATCTEKGTTRYSVSGVYDGFQYEDSIDKKDIPPIPHDYVSTTISPSCEEGGYTTHTCRVCGHSYDDDFTDAIGHSYSSSMIAPTCTESGYTLHTCSNCGNSYTDDPTDPLGHLFSPEYDWASDGSSCTVNFVCSRNSSHTMFEAVSSTSEIVSDPTFSSKGVTMYSISGTYEGISYSDSIEIADIDYVPEEEGGVTVYEDVIQPGIETDVTALFEAAEAVNGEVSITVPSDLGELTLIFDKAAAASIGGNAVTLTASIYLEDPEHPNAKLVLEVTLDGATFQDGKVTVSFPLEVQVPDGYELNVYYVQGESRTDMHATYENGVVTFTTNHFSTYVAVIEESPERLSIAYISVALAVFIGATVAFVMLRRH